ncbi:amidase family protein [Mesorhizobium sp.]|uniref:amidase n=1 Tax=Mesorhizobium sp. TaxID=1871066 RepID=UPI0025DFB86E|nr:amidase family protein [Mesorhizobium sp.]
MFGLKPSRALNPVGPYRGEVGAGLHAENVLSRTVRDSAAMLDMTAGPELGAPYRVSRSVPSYLDWLRTPSERLRIACLGRRADGTDVTPEIKTRFLEAMALLEELGHEVEEASFPPEADCGDGWSILWMSEIGLTIRERAGEIGRMPGNDEIERLSRHALERFEQASAADYLDAQGCAHRASLAMARKFDRFDLIMTPTTAELPPRLGEINGNGAHFDYEGWANRAYGFAPFTEIFNVTGQPAASLPLFQSNSGVPIGIQLVARQNEDHRLLRIAHELEQVTQWPTRHPPIWAGEC